MKLLACIVLFLGLSVVFPVMADDDEKHHGLSEQDFDKELDDLSEKEMEELKKLDEDRDDEYENDDNERDDDDIEDLEKIKNIELGEDEEYEKEVKAMKQHKKTSAKQIQNKADNMREELENSKPWWNFWD